MMSLVLPAQREYSILRGQMPLLDILRTTSVLRLREVCTQSPLRQLALLLQLEAQKATSRLLDFLVFHPLLNPRQAKPHQNQNRSQRPHQRPVPLAPEPFLRLFRLNPKVLRRSPSLRLL
jgi:hypothetical protein